MPAVYGAGNKPYPDIALHHMVFARKTEPQGGVNPALQWVVMATMDENAGDLRRIVAQPSL